jgi:hypothetical protein
LDPVPVSTSPTKAPTCLVLLGSLEPSASLSSTVAFLEWCRTQPDAPAMEVLAIQTGTAADQVRSVAPVTIVYDPLGWSPQRIAQRVGLQRPAAILRAFDLKRRLRIDGPVYVPDPAAGWLLLRLGPQAAPVVVHLHATSTGLDRLEAPERQALVERGHRWIVGSEAMATAAADAGADRARFEALPDLLTLPGMGELGADFLPTIRAELAQRHGIPVDAPLVAGTGNVDWWTTPDAFIRIAWETTRRAGEREVHFLWAADGATDRMLWPLRHDIHHAGLEGRVHIETSNRHPWHHIAAADVFVSSRLGDHDPVGHQEAAMLGRPVLWFTDPEATTPLVDEAAGTPVGHLDIDAMADAILAALPAPGRDRAALATGPSGAAWLPAIGGPAILAQLGARAPRDPDAR